MGSGNTVDHNLQHFDIDQDKSGIYHDMQDTRYRPLNHFALPDGNSQHSFPALPLVVVNLKVTAGFYVPGNGSYIQIEKYDGG